MVTAFLENTYVIQPDSDAVSASNAYRDMGVTLIYDDAMDELQILFEPGPIHRHVDPVTYPNLSIRIQTFPLGTCRRVF